MKNKVLIIAGMHRSGTSLVTQWLHRCGLHVGDQLLGKGIGNEDGHFEDMEFYTFHRHVLKSKNLPDSGFVDGQPLRMSTKDKSAALQMIGRKSSSSEQWGWKDPRTTLFLPDYHELIPEANYLVVFRDFELTVGSLITRTQKVIETQTEKREKHGLFANFRHRRIQRRELDELCRSHASTFLKVWIHYNQQILNFLKTIPADKFMVMNYESLLTKDHKVWSHLREHWQFSLDYASFSDVFKPGLISKKISFHHYIDDSLLHTAKALQKQLASNSFQF